MGIDSVGSIEGESRAQLFSPSEIKWVRKDLDLKIEKDKDVLLRTLWRYQMIERGESIDEFALCNLCEMNYNWFEMILYFVLRESKWGVVKFSSGRIGYK